MRPFVKSICALLALAILLALPVHASAGDNQRASIFFRTYAAYLEKTTTNHFTINYDVTGTEKMDEIGVSEIVLYRSLDETNWEVACTYKSSVHTSMICENTGTHDGYFLYCGTLGYYYQAKVTLYAKKTGVGTGYYYVYTNIIQL